MKQFIYFFTICLAFTSCISCGSKYTEEARKRATASAQHLLDNINEDELNVQRMVLNAKAEQSEYLLMGDSIAANEYDLAFREYIQSHNDSVAKILF